MDRIVITVADVERILAWRDEHVDLVRSMPCPLREVEIHITESGMKVKCFRTDKKLKLYIDSPSGKIGHVVFAPIGSGLWRKKTSTIPMNYNPAETEQGALTVYGSLMALMAYGIDTNLSVGSKRKVHTEHKSSQGRVSGGSTYIIKQSGKSLSVVQKGHHASPSVAFTVRGHYRHYQNGKIIWISEYQKGTGFRKRKNYKLCPKNCDI